MPIESLTATRKKCEIVSDGTMKTLSLNQLKVEIKSLVNFINDLEDNSGNTLLVNQLS